MKFDRTTPDKAIQSRRTILKASAALLTAGMLSPLGSALAQGALRRTQDQILGPFYPIMSKPNRSGDLTRVPGGSGRAKGQLLIVRGRVIDPAERPVEGAEVEIWQANSVGRYAHPDDTNPAPLDPNFEGYGAMTTGADGRYQFKTIKPMHYPAGPDMIRPAHIHFDVRGKHDELISQLYFEGDPYIRSDRFLQSAPHPEALIVKLAPSSQEPEFLVAEFDIVFRG